MKTKTIILNGENSARGIATIFEENELLQIRFRTYNTPELSPTCKIGLYHQKESFISNLIKKNGGYHSSFVGDFDINSDFYLAIIEPEQNNKLILSGGTYAGYFSMPEENSTPKQPEQTNECNCPNDEQCKNCIYKLEFCKK